MGVAINTTSGNSIPKTFDDQGMVIEETAARQIGILVSQVVEFARMRCEQLTGPA